MLCAACRLAHIILFGGTIDYSWQFLFSQGPVQAMVRSYPMQRSSARSVKFTELESLSQIPLLQENSHISDITTSLGKHGI